MTASEMARWSSSTVPAATSTPASMTDQAIRGRRVSRRAKGRSLRTASHRLMYSWTRNSLASYSTGALTTRPSGGKSRSAFRSTHSQRMRVDLPMPRSPLIPTLADGVRVDQPAKVTIVSV